HSGSPASSSQTRRATRGRVGRNASDRRGDMGDRGSLTGAVHRAGNVPFAGLAFVSPHPPSDPDSGGGPGVGAPGGLRPVRQPAPQVGGQGGRGAQQAEVELSGSARRPSEPSPPDWRPSR